MTQSEAARKLRSLPLISSVLERLKAQLSPDLTYHSHKHSEEVVEEAITLGEEAGLPAKTLELLAIAAAYHDAGFLEQKSSNEAIGAKLAAGAMEAAGYSKEDRELVRRMIMDTQLKPDRGRLRQIPSTQLSGYLLDADLGNLGRQDFFEKAELMIVESQAKDRQAFMKDLLEMVTTHSWHTQAAWTLKAAQQKINVEKLRSMLQS
jgi:predicted metal-dependent HD superfamily phosphohydrolase